MTLNFINAVKALPDDYCRDGLEVVLYMGKYIATHPDLAPIHFKEGEWKQIEMFIATDRVAVNDSARI